MNTNNVVNKRKSKFVVASTLGCDLKDMADYEYQPSRTTRPTWCFDNQFFACGVTKPTDWESLGVEWVPYKDQYWAEKSGTTLWVGTDKKGGIK